jgi:hypothetical protein
MICNTDQQGNHKHTLHESSEEGDHANHRQEEISNYIMRVLNICVLPSKLEWQVIPDVKWIRLKNGKYICFILRVNS